MASIDGPMGGVGRLEVEHVEHVEQLEQPAPVVVGVAGLERCLHGAPVGRPRHLVLAHQGVEGVLADHRVQGLAHNFVGMVDGGLGQPEEDALLAPDPLELVDQLVGHPLLGPGVDQMHDADQQLDQGVGDLPFPRDTRAASSVKPVGAGCPRR